MLRIVVLYPTRERAPASLHALTRAIDRLSGRHQVAFRVGLDPDDPTLLEAQSAMKGVHEAAHRAGARVEVLVAASVSKVDAANRLVPGLDSFDILIGHSDDMEIIGGRDGGEVSGGEARPAPQRPPTAWDDVVVTALMGRFPDGDGLLLVPDGRRMDIATWPVVGAEFLRNLPYNQHGDHNLWNPAYRTFCCDDELAEIARARNRCAMYEGPPIVEHRHPAWGSRAPDATDRRWSNQEERDRAILAARRSTSFDLKKPLLSVLTPTMAAPMERAAWVARVRGVVDDARRILRRDPRARLTSAEGIEWVVARFDHQDRGGPTIGEARRRMVCAASGMYAMFLDDDDTFRRGGLDVAEVVRAIVEHERRVGAPPDVVCFDVAHRCDPGEKWRMSRHEVGRPWRERLFAHDSTIYAWERPPNHINAFRTEILRSFPFDPDKRYAEDKDLAERIAASGVVLSHVHHTDIVYVYETPRQDATRKWT